MKKIEFFKHNLSSDDITSAFKETFGYKPERLPIANEIGNRTISLPLYPKLSEEEVRIVCNVFKKVISQLL